MSIFKKRLSRKAKLQIAAISSVVVALGVLIVLDIVNDGPLTHLLTNKEEVVAFVKSLGIFAPIAFMLVQVIQTVVAPIPGQVTGIVGGYIFDAWGILWTTIGSAIGFWLVFWLSRRFGRTLVEKIIKKESLDKFDYLTKEKGSLVFFLIFLIPGLPDDIVGYIAGLTPIPIKKLLAMVIIGRTPAVIMTNMLGAGLGESDIRPIVIASVLSIIVLAVVYIKREAIAKLLESFQKNNKSEDDAEDKKD